MMPLKCACRVWCFAAAGTVSPHIAAAAVSRYAKFRVNPLTRLADRSRLRALPPQSTPIRHTQFDQDGVAAFPERRHVGMELIERFGIQFFVQFCADPWPQALP
ncbi:MAG: hypothetical protein EON84_23070 [Bradyrhizobiaceae bacterium]|nr:MAG: hypothetical protein EON84_23070 [Bradyrhizobiaceae bacterium]